MKNFVVFSLARWSVEYGCNIRDICIELAKHHRVLYVDVPLKRKDRWFKRQRFDVREVEERISKGQQLIELAPNLWHYIDDSLLESVNTISNSFLFDVLNRINNKRFACAIQRGANAVGFDSFTLLNDNAIYDGLYLRKYLRVEKIVYYLRDRLPAMSYWKLHAGRLEPEIIKDADVVFTNSVYLSEYAKTWNVNSYYVGQGCDINHFLSPPASGLSERMLIDLKRPIVGYIGALNAERLDVQLIFDVASHLNEYSFVLIGKEDTVFKNSVLHTLNNVYFLGAKEFSDLPAYLYSFDVAINPQIVNDITVGNYPRKVDEYLAAGIPVVATRTLTMEAFKDHVYLGEGSAEYVTLINRAISENSTVLQQMRKQFASNHTWENSVKQMLIHI